MAASAELSTSATDGLPAPLPSSVMWLPASALNCYEGDATHRDWLLTPGLLTQRIRAAATDQFSMRLLNERRCGDEFVREIDIGEAIAEQTSLERAPFRFAQAYPDAWLVERALKHAGLAPRPIWVRHSAFRIEAAPFDLYEVFMPSIGSR